MPYTVEVQTTAGWSAAAELKDTAIVGRSNFKDLPLVISREHLRLYVEATGELRIECIGRNPIRVENDDGSLSAVRTGKMALLHPGMRVFMDMAGDHVVRVMPAHVLEAVMNVEVPVPAAPQPLLDDPSIPAALPDAHPVGEHGRGKRTGVEGVEGIYLNRRMRPAEHPPLASLDAERRVDAKLAMAVGCGACSTAWAASASTCTAAAAADDGDTAEPQPSLLPPARLEPHQRAACEPMPLDVREASRQLLRSKTAVVQCADGALLFLRQINESEAVGELLHGGGDRVHPTASLQLVTAYDSDEDSLLKDSRVTLAKRPRTIGSSSGMVDATVGKEPTAVEQMLCKAFPDVGPFGTSALEKALRKLEKFELACQGDDWADPECKATNTEALQYARARAVVKGLSWSLRESLQARGRTGTIERLMEEPFLGKSNATKIVEIFQTGTCQRTLARFERGEAPLDSEGRVRMWAHRHEHKATRPMTDGPAKVELSSVLCISAMTAIKLVHERNIRSIAQLRECPEIVRELHGGHRLDHSLRFHEQLQEPVPAEDACEMLKTVRETVRALRVPRAAGWHAELVGGGRTRGRAGHDVDILLWHKEEMASFMGSQGPVFVLDVLLGVLVEQGRVLPKGEAYFSRKCVASRHANPRPYLRQIHMAQESSKGFENLQHDHHDKFFGIWRSARTGKLHRIDLVVCSHPEELPFARLAWTGTRTLNRLMRLRAIDLGLYLGAHCFVARGDREGTADTKVVVEAQAGQPPEVITLEKLEHLPFKYVQSEEDILRVLACGTNAFAKLVDPTNRNA